MHTGPSSPMEDPAAILGVDAGATDEQVRAAYIAAVRRHPPDRDPQQFERIRDAYEELRDPRRRARRIILSIDPFQPLDSLLDTQSPQRQHVGPKRWLAAMQQRHARQSE